jgi:NAD(P)-dependent dehydrogenase (short-subunit alcohol dehydrogenase family)
MTHPLCDKVVLITGASSGIGRATALRLARHGARVVLAARSADALEAVAREAAGLGAQALAVPTDVTEPEQCRRAVGAAVERFGGLDVLLCSAGVSMRCSFEETELSAAERVMRVNFFGTLHATHFALPHVKVARGSLVAVSSLVGKRGTPTYSIYGASKFAVQGLYESLRLELAPDGVHVGVVSPGHVDTPLRERVLGPDGRPWADPPTPPFRVRPVEAVVDSVLDLIVRRRAEALLPPAVRLLFAVEGVVGTWLGDRWLRRRFDRAARLDEARRERQG